MNQTDRIQDLIFICQRLSEILIAENTALENNNAASMQSTLEEKDKLCRVYERHVQDLARKKDELDEVEPELREELKEVSKEMEELINRNATLLKNNIDIANRIVNSFAKAAQKATKNIGTYKDDAKAGLNAEHIKPLSLNQTL